MMGRMSVRHAFLSDVPIWQWNFRLSPVGSISAFFFVEIDSAIRSIVVLFSVDG